MVWVILTLVALISASALFGLVIVVRSQQRTAKTRHRAWIEMAAELPPGSRLVGVEIGSKTQVVIGNASTRSRRKR